MPNLDKAAIDDIFSYHAPEPDQIPKYEAIRAAARVYAEAACRGPFICEYLEAAAGFGKAIMSNAVGSAQKNRAMVLFKGSLISLIQSGDSQEAVLLIQQSVMMANASIALKGRF